jgi:hypothetical protein
LPVRGRLGREIVRDALDAELPEPLDRVLTHTGPFKKLGGQA